MIKMKSVIKLSLLGVLFFFSSCQNEPVDYEPPTEPVENPVNVIGKYDMIAYNTSVETDLDEDGVFSENQMEETGCYNGNTLEIKNDNTFVLTDKGVTIVTDENMIDFLNCYSKTNIIGTWTRKGNVLTLAYTVGNNKISKKYIISGETMLTSSESNVKVVATNGIQDPVYITTNVSKVYAMQ